MVKSINQHQGHTIKLRNGKSIILAEAKNLNGEMGVMIRAEGEIFPTIYWEELKECSCGEGK